MSMNEWEKLVGISLIELHKRREEITKESLGKELTAQIEEGIDNILDDFRQINSKEEIDSKRQELLDEAMPVIEALVKNTTWKAI